MNKRLVAFSIYFCLFLFNHELLLAEPNDFIRFKKQPESQIALKSARVVFNCAYEAADEQALSNLQVKWLYKYSDDDQQFKEIVHNANQYVLESSNNRLVILAYDPLIHTGQYRCMLNATRNSFSNQPISIVLLSEPASLSLASIDLFEQKEETTELSITEGNVAIISCKLPLSNPPALPVFYFNNQKLSINENEESTKYRVLPSGNLQIAHVKFTDAGVYTCGARNKVTNEIRTGLKKTILKVYEPFGTKSPEIIYVSSVSANRVQRGGNLTLECVANGAPVPLVSWEKFGGILPDKRSKQIFGNLVLFNMQPEDKGTYVCRAENGPGQATFKTVLVDIYEKPTLLPNENLKFNAKPGEKVQLKCPISSRPKAHFTWFFRGIQIDSNTAHFELSTEDNSILTIQSFEYQQFAGIYQCYAKNEYGSTQINLMLDQFDEELQSAESMYAVSDSKASQSEKRPNIILGPQNTTIFEGQSVVLLCITSEGSDNTQINWLQNDLIIEPTLMRRFEINPLLGNLRIVSVQKSDTGVYKCIASNEFGMSTAEAYVHVKSSEAKDQEPQQHQEQPIEERLNDLDVKKNKPNLQPAPTIKQIGADKILLKWRLINETDNSNNLIAFFKIDYKTLRQDKSVQANVWLTIDEQIDPKKREYILTDISKHETYRFRITTHFQSGESTHSFQSAKFRLDTNKKQSKEPILNEASDFKISHINVQITQIWAISTSSLGLKWKLRMNSNANLNEINGFYIYYRQLPKDLSNPSGQFAQLPLHNYSRINLPISKSTEMGQFVDTYIIENLEESSNYEIKMTCYNLYGDLCSFSNPIYGLTLSASSTPTQTKMTSLLTSLSNQEPMQSKANDAISKNDILFIILGVLLGILTLLMVAFIIMCKVRDRQNKLLLGQLHNTSQKFAGSSCPTLIYEEQNRSNNQLMTNQLFNLHTTDSNSTNSQSMSTTTSSMTTPPLSNLATTADGLLAQQQQQQLLLLKGNTIFSTLAPQVPKIPPPSIGDSQQKFCTFASKYPGMNINVNPLSANMEQVQHQMENKSENSQAANAENFYHTLSKMNCLSNNMSGVPIEEVPYSDYNNATLNMRAHYISRKQLAQLQLNTLKVLKQQQQQQLQEQNQLNPLCIGSPILTSMRHQNSFYSSKRSKSSFREENSTDKHNQVNKSKNYYLLPNQNIDAPTFINPHNIYNEVDLLQSEAALNGYLNNQNPNSVYLLNFHPLLYQIQQLPNQQNAFLNQQPEQVTNSELNTEVKKEVNESEYMSDIDPQETEPMLSNIANEGMKKEICEDSEKK